MECVLQRRSPPQNGDVSSATGDDSFVDELLNLNSENTQDDDDNDDDETPLNDKSSVLLSFPPPPQPPSTSGEGHFGPLLTLPEEEEEADLEWLSHFVEDSFAQFNHAAGITSPENQEPPFPAVLPRSRRSKRPRPAFPTTSRIWTSLSLTRSTTTCSSLTRSTTSSSSWSSSGTSSPSWPTSPSTPLALPDPNPKKKKVRAGPGPGPASVSGRKCSHCGTQKTPQWRAGPMGTKTLCNACGVRFKAGRLLPEYRPACSPTFSSEVHSNSHRKVLEMRMKKETTGRTEPGFVPAGPNGG